MPLNVLAGCTLLLHESSKALRAPIVASRPTLLCAQVEAEHPSACRWRRHFAVLAAAASAGASAILRISMKNLTVIDSVFASKAESASATVTATSCALPKWMDLLLLVPGTRPQNRKNRMQSGGDDFDEATEIGSRKGNGCHMNHHADGLCLVVTASGSARASDCRMKPGAHGHAPGMEESEIGMESETSIPISISFGP